MDSNICLQKVLLESVQPGFVYMYKKPMLVVENFMSGQLN